MKKTNSNQTTNRKARRAITREVEKVLKTGKTTKKKSSMRNAFIRVSAVNHLKIDNEELGKSAGDTVEYTKEDIKDILDTWCESKEMSYFFIEHNDTEDEEYPEGTKIDTDEVKEIGNKHFHIVLCFASPTSFEQIKKKFPYGKIESCHSVPACVQYLIHLNSPDKKIYQWSEVITNDMPKLEQCKIPISYSEEKTFTTVIYKIQKGEIKEYEMNKFDILFYIKYKRKIKDAFEFYYKSVMLDKDYRKNHPIEIIVLQGKTRAGKTTFAEEQSKNKGYAYGISSSSNDFIQDYMGEPVFILDDMSHETLNIKDFVKFLDPHKMSSYKSRYENKMFVGKTLYITCNVPITEWFPTAPEEDRESFFSRIDYVFDFSETANHNDGNSYYTVNRVDYFGDNGFKSFTDSKGMIHQRKKVVLVPENEEVKVFNLKDYVDLNADEEKRKKFLESLI